MPDVKRNAERNINVLLSFFPVVLIVGARQTGKTTLARKCCPGWSYYDLQKGSDFDFISRDYDFFFRENDKHIIIDEAQELPKLFKELRGVIDSDRQSKGRFVLTGSSSPDLLKEASDSLAGRIGIIEIGTLKMNETQELPLPSFYNLFKESLNIKNSISLLKEIKITESDTIKYFLKGGYPEPTLADDSNFYRQWMDNYYQTYINRDVKSLFPKLNSVKYRRFVDILSSLSGTIINKASVGRSIDVSEVTIRDYLEIAHSTFIWRLIPSYTNSKIKSVIKMPKGIFRDSGLAHYLAGIESREQLIRYNSVGSSFEGFVIEEILKGLKTLDIGRWDYYYYRTRNGSEVDLILEGSFGLLPVEIKFGSHTMLKQLTSLRKFIADNNLEFGIVINNSKEVQMLCDNVIQVPVGCI